MKLEKLKGLLVEHKKMNGKTQFDVVEATMISDWLGLDCSSRVDIFLHNNLHNIQVVN